MFIAATAMLLVITASYTGIVHAADYCHYPTKATGDCGISWPTTEWTAISSLNDPDDLGATTPYLDFVGNASYPAAYFASKFVGSVGYRFFRMRLHHSGTADGTTPFEGFASLMFLIRNTAPTAGDFLPQYAFAWDAKSDNNLTHGMEMLRFLSSSNGTWGGIKMTDVDGNSGSKGKPDINNTADSRSGDGYIRTVDSQDTGLNFGVTTFVDFAISCDYLQYLYDNTPDVNNPSKIDLRCGGTWYLQLASLKNANDHNFLDGDIGKALNPTSTVTNTSWSDARPTLAVIHNVKAYTRNGQVIIGWDTASEVATLGFNVYRVDPASGAKTLVNAAMVPAMIESPHENEYYAVDASAAPGEQLTYILEEVESKGTTRTYGPYIVTAREELKMISPASLLGEPSNYGRSAKTELPKPSVMKTATRKLSGNARTKSINIGIREPGLYRLDATDIATAFGMQLPAVRALLKTNQFNLSCRGKQIGIMPAGDGSALYFYGENIESIYTDLNMYTLRRGRATLMPMVSPSPPSADDGSPTFVDQQHIEKNAIAAPAGFSDTEGDFWVWDYMVAGDPQLQTKVFDLPVQAVAEGGKLMVNLRGLSQSGVANEHFVRVNLNGQPIGQDTWDGTEPRQASFDLPEGLLLEGNNTVEITAELQGGTPHSYVAVDSFDISYKRFYKAFSDRLALRGDNSAEVVVNGFSSARIWVFDLSNKGIPSVVRTARTGSSSAGAWVKFRPESPEMPYLAVSATGALRPYLIAPAASADLKAGRKGVDYLIITTNDLRNGAGKLAAYRSGKGLRTLVVTTDEIYNEFSWGIATPHAIQDFIKHAVSNWKPSPRFVVLAGDGSYDYKNFLGYGDSLVPSLLTKNHWSIDVSDALLVDVKNSDGLQDIAVGRIPVTTDAQLVAYVSKIARLKAASGDWKKKVLLVADNPDAVGNFPADSDDIASVMPSWLVPERIYMPPLSFADARNTLLPKWKEGTRFVSYFGHAAYSRIAPEGLLTKDDVPLLGNTGRLPIVTGMSCHIGQFGIPGIETIGEALVKQPDGGAAAVWAPASAAYNGDSKMLAVKFWKRLAAAKESTLGEAVSTALKDYRDEGGAAYILNTYTILGDPAISVGE
jgi:hypothetical protein